VRACGQAHRETARLAGLAVSNIFTKLQVADRAQAIIKARDAGLGTAERSP